MKTTSLAVMRLQPLHRGHCRLINRMIQDFEVVIVGIGSADKSRTSHNPFTIEERIEMVRNVFGKRVKIVPLEDIGLVDITDEWCDYVLHKIESVGLPRPTDYFCGSKADSLWYKYHFDGDHIHIRDRSSHNVPPATEIRTAIQLRDDSWKEFVPVLNHEIVEQNYPEKYRIVKNTFEV